jgi:penicillin-binding protein 1A
VLSKLRKYDYIKCDAELDSIQALPIELNFRVQNQNVGLAPYFRSIIQTELMAWCKELGYDLWNSGLKIYTTIDSRLQTFAEDAVTANMAKQQKDFTASWKGVNPWVNEANQEIPGFLQSRIKHSVAYRIYKKKYGDDTDSLEIMLNVKKKMRVFTWTGEVDTLFSSYDSLTYYKKFLQTGFLSMDANTGEIKAWVGGIDHKFFKYDHVRQGKRQPGSTFKPFVYGAAIEAEYHPCYKLPDISPQFKVAGGFWSPLNSDGTHGTGEEMTIRQAMARSVNSITARLVQLINPENAVAFAHRVGIQSDLDAVPSISLGVSEVSLFELVGAYSTFVNSGVYTTPYYISRIEDKNGNVIENFTPKRKEAISEQTAYKMVYMLRGGVEEAGGSSQWLNSELKKDNEIGGNTGTTDNASDAWYMGITKDLVSGVWLGGDERSIHFKSWTDGQGAKTARPIWESYMLKVYSAKDLPYKKGPFKHPPDLDISLNCNDYEVLTIQE